jgi:hypothetical protein
MSESALFPRKLVYRFTRPFVILRFLEFIVDFVLDPDTNLVSLTQKLQFRFHNPDDLQRIRLSRRRIIWLLPQPLPSANCLSFSVLLCVASRPSVGGGGGGPKSNGGKKTRSKIKVTAYVIKKKKTPQCKNER